MLLEIDGYDLIPDSYGHADKINNILVSNNINQRRIMVKARYNYTAAYWMWVPFGDNTYIDSAISAAVDAMQKKFGPGLPVHNNYENAKKLKPLPQYTFTCSNKEKIIYGCMFGLVNTSEAADILGVSRKMVQSLIKRGRLPAEKIGRDWMIKREDVEMHERGKPGVKPIKTTPPYHVMLKQNDEEPKYAYCDYKAISSAKRMAKSLAPWQPNREPKLQSWVVDDEGRVLSKIYSTEHHDPI
jgi:excisionase family DNA binding protein